MSAEHQYDRPDGLFSSWVTCAECGAIVHQDYTHDHTRFHNEIHQDLENFNTLAKHVDRLVTLVAEHINGTEIREKLSESV